MTLTISKTSIRAVWFRDIGDGHGWLVEQITATEDDDGETTSGAVILASGVVDTEEEAQEVVRSAGELNWSPMEDNGDIQPEDEVSTQPVYTSQAVYWKDKHGDLRSTDRGEDAVLALMATGRGI